MRTYAFFDRLTGELRGWVHCAPGMILHYDPPAGCGTIELPAGADPRAPMRVDVSADPPKVVPRAP